MSLKGLMTGKMQDFEAWQIIMNERKEIRRIKRLDQGLFDLLLRLNHIHYAIF